MRILIISDSHNRPDIIERLLLCQPDARHVFFLGDMTGDIEDALMNFHDRVPHVVSGNCDVFSTHRTTDIVALGGKKIFMTHGHKYGVKQGTQLLQTAARAAGCDIVLYGHTHIPETVYDDGLYIVNPGSCAEGRNGNTYAVIDITENGVMPVIINVR